MPLKNEKFIVHCARLEVFRQFYIQPEVTFLASQISCLDSVAELYLLLKPAETMRNWDTKLKFTL